MLTSSSRIGSRTFFFCDRGEVVDVAAIVALQRHQPDFFLIVPDELAGGVLDIEIDVVRMLVRPGHGDQELGLLLDLALAHRRMHGEERDEEQECDDLQGLEQHDRERIEPVLAQ